LAVVAVPLTAVAVVCWSAATGSTASFVNWPAYMFQTQHSSTNPASTAITPANASNLVQVWNWVPDPPTMTGQPANDLFASPTVYNGKVYIGANTGVFYALDESNGQVLWSKFIGFVPAKTLGARGITSTATVTTDPATGKPTVYVAGGDGYLYALDADTGAQVWKSVVMVPSDTKSDYYNWSSPNVAGGHVYMPIASQGDKPLVRAGVKMYDQATGALLAFYHAVPTGKVGASIWSSATTTGSGSDVWITTGNVPASYGPDQQYDSVSIVRLNGETLQKVSRWRVPLDQQIFDSDFGGSPTPFTANLGGVETGMVGACNKNGIFYALRRGKRLSDGPVWQFQVGAPDDVGPGLCIAGAVWDGSRLFLGGNATTIGGTQFEGSIRELDPATGTPVWETGLTGNVLGGPTENGSGVLGVGSWDYNTGAVNRLWLVDASNGHILNTLNLNSAIFAQPVFADFLLVASQKKGLFAFRPGP
jgi:outer membrane protein assembly factor BamB